MRIVSRFFLALLATIILVSAPPVNAARDMTSVKPVVGGLRLIVITAPGCIYCRVFRRDVEPVYERSQHGEEIPLVYLDINDQAAKDLLLQKPVSVVPTVVLVAGNREVNRIDGYVGPKNFFIAIRHMLGNI